MNYSIGSENRHSPPQRSFSVIVENVQARQKMQENEVASRLDSVQSKSDRMESPLTKKVSKDYLNKRCLCNNCRPNLYSLIKSNVERMASYPDLSSKSNVEKIESLEASQPRFSRFSRQSMSPDTCDSNNSLMKSPTGTCRLIRSPLQDDGNPVAIRDGMYERLMHDYKDALSRQRAALLPSLWPIDCQMTTAAAGESFEREALSGMETTPDGK